MSPLSPARTIALLVAATAIYVTATVTGAFYARGETPFVCTNSQYEAGECYPRTEAQIGPKYNRSAVVKDKEGNVVHDFGGHRLNPFDSAAECQYGVDGDVLKITEFLMLNGLDPSTFEVVVSCSPNTTPI